MSDYWSGKMVYAGFATNTDFNSIIDATVNMEKFRYNQLSKQEAEIDFKKEQISGLNRTLLTYQDQLKSMDTMEEFLVKKASTSKAEVASVSVKSGAAEGTHQLDVKQLASVATVTSNNLKEVVHTGPTTDMTFEYDDNEYTVTVKKDMTVKEFAAAINSASNGKVKASVIDIGVGGNYKIQMRGMDLGAGHDIKLSDGSVSDPSGDPSNNLKGVLTGSIVTEVNSNLLGKIVHTGEPVEMTYKFDGVEHSFTVTKDMTVHELAVALEDASDGAVKVLVVGDGSGEKFTIKMSGKDAPSEDGFELSSELIAGLKGATPDTDLTMTRVAKTDPLVVKESENSIFELDGIELQRDTNSVSDVTEGVTYSLNSIEDDITIKIETDLDAIASNVEKFVQLTNELREGFKLVTEYKNEELDKKNVKYSLKGNTSITSVEDRLKRMLTTPAIGFIAGTGADDDPYTSLSILGIRTNVQKEDINFGKLEFDKDAGVLKGEEGGKSFMDILREDPEAVARVFAGSGKGSSDDLSTIEFQSSMFDLGFTKAGEYSVEYEGDISFPTDPDAEGYATNQVITVKINGKATQANYEVATGSILIQEGDALGISFRVADNSPGIHSAKISIRQGKVQETIKELDVITDGETGIFNIMVKQYTNQISNPSSGLTKKMEDELSRVEALEKRLIAQYSKTETLLGQYQNTQKMLEFQLKSQLAQDD